MTAHGFVARDGALQGAVELAGEDDVDDVLRPQAPLRRDRLDDRDRPLDGQLVVLPDEPCLLRELALERVHERLAAANASAGEQPVLSPALLVAERRIEPRQWRSADTRIRGSGRIG